VYRDPVRRVSTVKSYDKMQGMKNGSLRVPRSGGIKGEGINKEGGEKGSHSAQCGKSLRNLRSRQID